MCGIVACRTHAPAMDYLLTALRRLEYRGYDSVGVAVQTAGGDIARFRTTGRIAALEGIVGGWAGPALNGVGIGHTRWATHGPVTEDNAHPHSDCGGRISLVHNGIIEGADRLRHALALSGHHFASEVDSEVLCHLIEDQLAISGDLYDAVQAALTPLTGSWAIAVLERGTGRVVVAAARSPLLIARTENGVFAASDIAAVADWVEDFRVLDDGEVVEITADIRVLNSHAVPSTARCGWAGRDAGLDGYVDYMAKEIDEQPAAATRVIDEYAGRIVNGSLWADLGLPAFSRLQVLGCGTSLNAGQVIANVVRRVGRMPVTVTVASEAADEIIDPGSLCLAMSQSGETADLLSALSNREAGAPVLALTNSAHSTLARKADASMTCAAGPEIGVAATKTFVCQVISGVALVLSALVADGRLSNRSANLLVDELRRIPDQLVAAGAVAKCVVPTLADELSSASGFLFIARGSGLPYAAEGALKLKELTYRWAEHHPAGELKHGPLALVENGTPVVVIDNGDPRLSANVAEVETRGGRVIRIGAAGSTVPVVGRTVAPWGPLETVIPLQILARTMALCLGCDVDKPRNLAKSVTVE